MALNVNQITVWHADAQAVADSQWQSMPSTHCLQVTCQDKPGLGSHISNQLAANGLNIRFAKVDSSSNQYSAIFMFENEEDANRAVRVIEEAERTLPTVLPSRRNIQLVRGKGYARGRGTVRGGRMPRAVNQRKQLDWNYPRARSARRR